jgi:hypothetical protein
MVSKDAVQSPLPVDYRRACEHIAEQIYHEEGFKAMSVRYHGDYVDIWVTGESDRRFALIRPLGEAIQAVQAAYPNLRLETHVTDQPAPEDFIIWADDQAD